MRKIMRICLIMILSVLLISCVPQDEETRLLQKQYDDYMVHDIANDLYFDAFINGVSNEIIPGVVVIKMTGKDVFNRVIETSIGTGFIFQTYESHVKVLTAATLVEQKQSSLSYTIEFIDFANQSYTGQIKHVDASLGLATLEFNVHVASAKLKKLNFSSFEPRIHEPLLMISNYQGSRNSLLMGLLLGKDDTLNTYQTSIPMDQHCIGGTLMNMQHQVIGLVISYEEGQAVCVDLDAIQAYIKAL